MIKYWNYLVKIFDYDSGAVIYERSFNDLDNAKKYCKKYSRYIILDLDTEVGMGFKIVGCRNG